MVVIRSFWSPCYWYEDVRTATKPIAFYTAIASVIMITYTCYVLNGGESSQFYMPYFEADLQTTMPIAGGFAIIFFLLFLGASWLLVKGVEIENRAFMLPWMVAMSIVILYQVIMGIHWLFNYYIYLQSVLAILCMWVWMSYNIYCLLSVISTFQIIRIKQQPEFVVIYE